MTLPDAALGAVAALALLASWHRPPLRPIAGALLAFCGLTAALAYAEGREGWERVSVALYAGAWPGVVALLVAHRDVKPSNHLQLRLHQRRGEGESRKKRRGAPTCSGLCAALLVALYGLALARWGCALAPWWPAPLEAPRVAVGLLAGWVLLRKDRALDTAEAGPAPCGFNVAPVSPTTPAPKAEPRRSPAQRVGLVLALAQLVGVAVGLWASWPSMRAYSAGVWVLVGAIVVQEARRRPR